MAGVVTHQKAAVHTASTDGIAPPPGDYESWDAYMLDVEQLEAWRRDETCVRGLKAMRLAPTLEVYRALISGQEVPRHALDQRWTKRYGL